MSRGFKNSIPKGWLGCPQNGNSLVADIFMPLKTPLDHKYDSKLHQDDRYHPKTIFTRAERNKKVIGLWIDLTNTDRYYHPYEIEERSCRYVKLKCTGHGRVPPRSDIDKFLRLCKDFTDRDPDQIIAIHCTHGFNRTGFLIVIYLVEILNYDVMTAVKLFANARPPGIYRENYLVELFRLYGDVSRAPRAPPEPSWCSKS
ncbi:mRNA-capping enzyme-like [Diabrotica virgifera virgifera]|uniref:Tyrosine specific protein phosphatases domain-containing protein n=1 Tax=Diabrotica virgifera virgifera TaxID=50390 RepID=A0ABM5L0J3_DIAVI|nr:mRNA-capping enzyme-like [Diabrotica virgifera virgifera]